MSLLGRILVASAVLSGGLWMVSNINSLEDQNLLQILRHAEVDPQRNEIAERVISWMDNSTDPCEDFYQFSCGGALKHNPSYESDKGFLTPPPHYAPFSFEMRRSDAIMKKKKVFEDKEKPIRQLIDCSSNVTSQPDYPKMIFLKRRLNSLNQLCKKDFLKQKIWIKSEDFGKLFWL
jgi:hypothetical protein